MQTRSSATPSPLPESRAAVGAMRPRSTRRSTPGSASRPRPGRARRSSTATCSTQTHRRCEQADRAGPGVPGPRAIRTYARAAATACTRPGPSHPTRRSATIIIVLVRKGETMSDYAPGTPSWVELSSPDTDAAAEFYGGLMGWNATEPGGEETGGHRMFQQDGKNVGGLMGHMQEGQPTAWATYI